MRLRRLPLRASALGVVLVSALCGGRARAETGPLVEFTGILRGTTLVLDPYFKWKPSEASVGILGTVEGTTREFESIPLEIGADRSVFTAAERVAFEADHVKRYVQRGELVQEISLSPGLSIVRFKMKNRVYACAAKQIGRTALFARGEAESKDEAALSRLVAAIIAGAKSTADEIDGWIPMGVKVAWVREAAADLVVEHDGVVKAALKDDVVRAVKDAHAVVRRAIPGSWAAPFPPVLRVTANRELFAHLTGRRDAGESDASYVASVGELLVVAKSEAPPDAALVRCAVEQALHHALGAANAQPIAAGLARYALAIRGGAPVGALLPEGEAQALSRAKGRLARTWSGMLKLPSVVNYLATESDTRPLDAEMAVVYLLHSGGAQAKASLEKWAGGFRKFGHPDAAAEAALHDLIPEASDAEYWKFWIDRATPKKPGSKPK